MERLAIIDHNNHNLYIEDVSDEALAKYNGSEEDYIKDNYSIEGNFFSWDYITSAQYFPEGDDPDPVEVNFKDLVD